ncbi:hypothetical protein C450_03667 [Halococcus salifodinae DSM 8989]|uniref:Uncharacterized protein n=1 Tax=Halococcus salifodinae DSM 8989 TaxID=1227456 RepID=M0NDG8_9EURY|nr:hypothetical protein C450_03667 [Halococcus salifodinae DSM 8989]
MDSSAFYSAKRVLFPVDSSFDHIERFLPATSHRLYNFQLSVLCETRESFSKYALYGFIGGMEMAPKDDLPTVNSLVLTNCIHN